MAWLLLSNSHSPTGRLISKIRFVQFGLKEEEHVPAWSHGEEADLRSRTVEENSSWLLQVIKDAYNRKAAMEHSKALHGLERFGILNAVDRLWQEHLYAMDGLREAVYRAFAQKDPLVEYENEAFAMFGELMDNIKREVLNNLFRSATN